MHMQKATHLALALLVAAGAGVAAGSAKAHSSSKKKSSAHSNSAAHRTNSTKHSRKSHRHQRGQKAPTPERITEIQQALAKDGSFNRSPNGKWDSSTVDAMKKYQEAHGLNPSGKLDAKTLTKLGLGSRTAGAAPPFPPVTTSAAANLPSRTATKQQ